MDNVRMDRRKRMVWICLVALLLVFIWGNSLLPGAVSGQESEWVKKLLSPVLTWLQGRLGILGLAVDQSYLVRKLAHFCEYMLLGFLTGFMLQQPEGKTLFLPAEGLCLGAAIVDELLQHIAPDRGPSVKDVLLDLSGATVGLAIAMILLCLGWLWGNRKRI